MDSISSRKKIHLPVSRLERVKKIDASPRQGATSENQKEEYYNQDTNIPVRRASAEKAENKQAGIAWLRKLLFSGFDLDKKNKPEHQSLTRDDVFSENKLEKIPQDYQAVDFSITEEKSEIISDEKEGVVSIRNVSIKEEDSLSGDEITEQKLEVSISDIEVREDADGKIKVKKETETIVVEQKEEDNVEVDDGRNLTNKQQEEIIILAREAMAFHEEIEDLFAKENSYSAEARIEARELAIKAHILKLMRDDFVALQDINEDFRRQIAEAVVDMIVDKSNN